MPGIYNTLSYTTQQPHPVGEQAFRSLHDLKTSFDALDNASFQARFTNTPQDIKIELARCAVASNETELVKYLLNVLTPKVALREQLFTPGSKLAGYDFSGAELSNLCAPQLHFQRCNLSHCSLENNRLVRAELEACDMRNSAFRGSQLPAAKLVNCNLAGSSLFQTSLAGAHLESCSLRDCDLRHANLVDARLVNTTLGATRFDGAIMNGCTLRLNDAELKQHFADLKSPTAARKSLESVLNSIASINGKYQPLKDRLFQQVMTHSALAQGRTPVPADTQVVADIFTEHPEKKRFIKENMALFLNLSMAGLTHPDQSVQNQISDLITLHSADIIGVAEKS